MKTKQEQIEEIVVAYKNAICCGQSYGSIYDYMRIIGLKKKQQKEVTKYISKLREVQRQKMIDREQIEEMARAMCGFCVVDKRCVLRCCAPCIDVESKDCSYKEDSKMLIDAGYGNISDYKAYIEQLKDENCELTEKLAKQTRIARDANAKFTGVEHYLKPFQYKADRLKTKCDDLKKLSDWQREEIKRLKAEVNKGCDNCETIKQGQVDVLKELKKRIYGISPYNPLISKDNVKYYIDKLINEIENDK